MEPFLQTSKAKFHNPSLWCYGEQFKSHFLPGCPQTVGCAVFRNLAAAQHACSAAYDCGGLTSAANEEWYELRASADPVESPMNENAWPRTPCDTNSSAESVIILPKPPNIVRAFIGAVDGAIADPKLRLTGPDRLGLREPVREDDSIFVGIAAYRDATWCMG